MSSAQPRQSLSEQFPTHWQASTADSNLTLHGFRRFKTTHLLNLRYLEYEISEIDHLLYQLGLGLNMETSETDRLGLKHCKRDEAVPPLDKALSKQLVHKLRRLLKEYDDAVLAFSSIMKMDTFSLLDDESQWNLKTGLSLEEMFKTRLLRIDQQPRVRQDPLQRYLHKILRLLRYKRIRKSGLDEGERAGAGPRRRHRLWPSQNTALMADVISRIVVAVVTAAFLTAPLVSLSKESGRARTLLLSPRVLSCLRAWCRWRCGRRTWR